MTTTNPTLTRARDIADALPSAHPALLRSELRLLLDVLDSDASLKALLEGLEAREKERIADTLAAFADGRPAPAALSLDGAATPAQRAALGLLLTRSLVEDKRWPPLETANRFADIGRCYALQGHAAPHADAVGNFLRVFLNPLLDHLAHERTTDDLIRATLLRYKQRSEWFERDRLMDIVRTKDTRTDNDQLERRLKTDLHRYLFDSRIDFVLEPYTPSLSGKPDIVSVNLFNGRRLVLEAKVYDGYGQEDVRHGIQQAKFYADEWGEPFGYCLVYNVAARAILEITGTQRDGPFYSINVINKHVKVLVINLSGASPSPKSTNKGRKMRLDLARLER
jgi:hypothetical protein